MDGRVNETQETHQEAARRLKVYYLASGVIAVPGLLALLAHPGIEVVGIGTQPDRPAGRRNHLTPTPVGEKAVQLGLTCDKPASCNEPSFLESLRRLELDAVIVVAYGQLLKKDLLGLPRLGCVNVHASLLPRFRGASPIASCLLAGDAVTGVTTMLMDRGLDTGPQLRLHPLAVDADETSGSLEAKLARLAAEILPADLLDLAAGRLGPTPQDPAAATLCAKISKSEAALDFSLPATELERRIRAYQPWPGAFTYAAGPKGRRRLVATAAACVPLPPGAFPGSLIAADKKGILIACGQDALLLTRLIPEGKGEMSTADFLLGFPLAAGTVLSVNPPAESLSP